MCWTYFEAIGHSLKKYFPLSENSSPPLVSQAGYGPAENPYKIPRGCRTCG